jgi:hypothetical protein
MNHDSLLGKLNEFEAKVAEFTTLAEQVKAVVESTDTALYADEAAKITKIKELLTGKEATFEGYDFYKEAITTGLGITALSALPEKFTVASILTPTAETITEEEENSENSETENTVEEASEKLTFDFKITDIAKMEEGGVIVLKDPYKEETETVKDENDNEITKTFIEINGKKYYKNESEGLAYELWDKEMVIRMEDNHIGGTGQRMRKNEHMYQ